MRSILIVTFIITAVSVIYKWRYKLMNTILAISFLRRIAISITMNMPAIRKKLVPNMFSGQSNS